MICSQAVSGYTHVKQIIPIHAHPTIHNRAPENGLWNLISFSDVGTSLAQDFMALHYGD